MQKFDGTGVQMLLDDIRAPAMRPAQRTGAPTQGRVERLLIGLGGLDEVKTPTCAEREGPRCSGARAGRRLGNALHFEHTPRTKDLYGIACLNR